MINNILDSKIEQRDLDKVASSKVERAEIDSVLAFLEILERKI